MSFLYLAVALFSTTIGSLSGLGGGVIIKPVLDAVAPYDAATIGILSSFTVFSMAVVSSIRQYSSGVRFEGRRTVFLVIGSTGGGIGGKFLFSALTASAGNPEMVTAVQSIILALLLFLVLLYMSGRNAASFHIHNGAVIIAAGFLLGLAASFLGVGGGPFNVVLLTLLFSMDSKSAAVHSILIILFSQAAKLLALLFGGGFAAYELTALYFMIPGGIAGGIAGAWLHRYLHGNAISRLFRIVLAVIIVLNLYNYAVAMKWFTLP